MNEKPPPRKKQGSKRRCPARLEGKLSTYQIVRMKMMMTVIPRVATRSTRRAVPSSTSVLQLVLVVLQEENRQTSLLSRSATPGRGKHSLSAIGKRFEGSTMSRGLRAPAILCLCSRNNFLYLVVALVVVGEGEIGGRHLVLLRPPAAHSAMAKICDLRPAAQRRDSRSSLAQFPLSRDLPIFVQCSSLLSYLLYLPPTLVMEFLSYARALFSFHSPKCLDVSRCPI